MAEWKLCHIGTKEDVMKKKIVSILLVFCMLLGIMPTSLVSAAEAITAEYVFRLAGEQHDKAKADTAKAYADSFSENWSWYGKSWASDAATTAIFRQSNKATYNVNDRIYVQNIAVDEWFALDIKTPEVSGAYAVDFDYSRLSSSNAGASDIYLIEKPSGDFNKDAVNAALGNSSPIGNIDCGGASVSLEKLTKKLKWFKFLRVIMCITLVLIPLVIMKTTPKIRLLRSEIENAEERAAELFAEANAQMLPLNSLFGDRDALSLIEETLPLISFDTCFSVKQEEDMKINYDFCR